MHFRKFKPSHYLLFGLCISLLGFHALGQKKEDFFLYFGRDAFQLEVIPYSRPPFISVDSLIQGLKLRPATQSGNLLQVMINQRMLELDSARQEARFTGKTVPVAIQKRSGKFFIQAQGAVRVFSPLMGRQMIYDRTSRSLHLPLSRDLVAAIRTRQLRDGLQLSLVYNQPVKPPKVESSGRKLIVRLDHSPILFDRSGFQANEAVSGMEVFDKLPNGSTEILFSVSDVTTSFKTEPFDSKNPRTVIKFSGVFSHQEQANTQELSQVSGLRKIVIDPGHGGKDRGALGPSGLKEKDVTLDLAYRIKHILQRQYNFDVQLTRGDDSFLSLKQRTGLANNAKADLFLSIHVNAVPKGIGHGSETYYLSMDGDTEASDPHYQELPGEEAEAGNGEDADDDLSMILWDMAQTKYIEDSFRISGYVQNELNTLAGIRSRGVKQAPLKVLQGAQMPAILVEVAFITNPNEEKKLKDPHFKEKIARSIASAIKLYDSDVVKRAQGGTAPPKEGME